METPASRATSLMVTRPSGSEELTGADMLSQYSADARAPGTRPHFDIDIDNGIEIVIDIDVDID
ncbi:hypothetical protein GCM10009617_37050 [Leifsonia poae]